MRAAVAGEGRDRRGPIGQNTEDERTRRTPEPDVLVQDVEDTHEDCGDEGAHGVTPDGATGRQPLK
jgi:hypothetical protein